MGIFDGFLLLSDIDGTFEREKSCPEPKANVDAIRYFTQNGGRFAFATGRMSEHLYKRGFDRLVNAPVCLGNGGMVYDLDKKTVLYQKTLGHTISALAEFTKSCGIPIVRFMTPTGTAKMDDPVDIYNVPEHLKDAHPTKAVAVFESAEDADRFSKIAMAYTRFDDCFICKSWTVGVEILRHDATKGQALDFIKEYTGCHTAVGIGDYGNDIPLLKHADIGVAVGNATDELKATADHVVCDCESGAIAELIDILKKTTD